MPQSRNSAVECWSITSEFDRLKVFANLVNAAVCAAYALYFALLSREDPLLRGLCLVVSVIAAILALQNALTAEERSKLERRR